MITYLLMGLVVTLTNTLILAAMRAPQGGSPWVLPAVIPLYIALWPLLLGMWVYRALKPVPWMDTRLIPEVTE